MVAVVPQPGGAHPAPVQGYWRRDHGFMRQYAEQSRSRDGFERWLRDWVLEVPDRAAYLNRVDGLEELRVRRHRLSAPADFGSE